MLISALSESPLRALQYLERYVNDGSPSGFTEVHRTLGRTDPFGFSPWFNLILCQGPVERFSTIGEIPNDLDIEGNNWMFVHPDMEEHELLRGRGFSFVLFDELKVIPTSSARTVQLFDGTSRDYIKLHYEGIIGRINRGLPYLKAVAGPELSAQIGEELEEGGLPDFLCILPETGARVAYLTEARNEAWGMVWRRGWPIGSKANDIDVLIPFFSLFSVDRLRSYDPPLLKQVLLEARDDPQIFVLDKLLGPIQDGFFSLLIRLGLQMEINAQNLLVGMDSAFEPVAIVLRDMMGVEKDLTLRSRLGLPVHFASAPYKCISVEDEHYQIRHSFAYDFKLGEYVFEPVIKLVHRLFGSDPGAMRAWLRERARHYIRELPTNFYPDGVWYTHEKVYLNDQREYYPNTAPKFR